MAWKSKALRAWPELPKIQKNSNGIQFSYQLSKNFIPFWITHGFLKYKMHEIVIVFLLNLSCPVIIFIYSSIWVKVPDGKFHKIYLLLSFRWYSGSSCGVRHVPIPLENLILAVRPYSVTDNFSYVIIGPSRPVSKFFFGTWSQQTL